MNHEYRESPYAAGICAGCGLSFSLCQGMKSRAHASMAAEVSLWDAWCRRFGIDPNTPDETVLDDYLHGRLPAGRPVPRAPRVMHHSLTARAEIHELERWLRL